VRSAGAHEAIVDERGVTLVEVVAALAIISIGLAGLIVLVPVSTYAVQEGGQLSTATFLAEQMIERARASRWSADPATDCLGVSAGDAAPLPSESSCHGIWTTQFPDEAEGISGHAQYRRVVRVTGCEIAPACAGLSGIGMRRVTVSVRYTPLPVGGGQSPAPRTVQLEWLTSRK
jgi:prepilin-type N-terminal cleavage/methylation domain-containing protein